MQPLTPDQHKRIERLFDAAMEQQPSDIGVWLSAQCPDDEIVREHVRKLLLASAATANIRDHLDPKHLNFSPALNDDTAGESIGPYRLLEVIGEGGFGVVWLAERREPMVQRVALKIIKPGMDSKAVIARFEQERQALAVMDHPNVAKVLDGGVTKNGRPYFVMEHVKGEPITAFADRHRLTIKQRLELFIPVCEAVQHAHHKGLIHRDIKPSNVLVAEIEGKAVPKVIDFGVAKAITDKGWLQTAHTQLGAVIGTTEYMSPEQVAGEIGVDTRSDVYSLGVLLYEMLTGELPFDSQELRKAALVEIARIIREVTPPKPSTRLAQLAGNRTTTIAQARSTSSERMASELRRELDWIPLMALRKERERRYASPQALADDVQRYLDGLPLHAAPDSKVYLARKFVRRNKVQVFAASAVLIALTTGLGVALWQRSMAIEARDAEKERADQLKKVSDFQSGMLGQIDTTQAGIDLMTDVRERFVAELEKSGVPEADRKSRVDALRQELVRVNATDTAAAMIDRTILKPAIKTIDEQFKDDPKTDASLRQALADLYQRIGLYDAAMPLQEAALATRRRVLGEAHQNTLMSINSMGYLLQTMGKLQEAVPFFREALQSRRRQLGAEHPDTLNSINNMGALLYCQGLFDEAEPYLREALEGRSRVLGTDHPDTLITLNDLSLLFSDQGKLAQAENFCRESLEKSRRVLGENHRDTLISINNLGFLLQEQGKLQEAEMLYIEALEKSRRLLGEDHPDTIISINNMGYLLRDQGRFQDAERFYIEALERSRRVLGDDHPNTLISINSFGFLLQSQGKLQDAEPFIREALEKRRRVLGGEHPDTLRSINNMGFLLHKQGKLQSAEPFYREALETRRRVLGEAHPETLTSLNNIGGLLQDQGNFPEAEIAYRESLEKTRSLLGDHHEDTIISINNMGYLFLSQGRLQEAEPFYREALQKSHSALGPEHPSTIRALHSMGALLQAQGKLQEAEPFCRQALDLYRRVLGEEHPDTLVASNSMGTLLLSQGKFVEAETLMRAAEDMSLRSLGMQHPTTITITINLGMILTALNRQQDAIGLLAEIESTARLMFTGGNQPRLAAFLSTLGRARAGIEFDPARFTLAEANLLEAHSIYIAAKDRGPTHKDTLECVQALVDLYTSWDKAEPGKGYDAKAAEWRATLDDATQPTQ